MSRSYFISSIIALSTVTASFAQPFWQLQTDLDGLVPPASPSAVSDHIAWLCDFNGQVWRTIDAGKAWRPIGPVTHEEKIVCLAALDSNIAIVGGAGAESANGSANLYRTSDGGRSWQVVYTAKGPTPFWYALHVFDVTNAIALNDAPSANENFLIEKTHDAGVTWRRVAQSPPPQEKEFGLSNACFFYDHLHGWFGTVVGMHQNLGGRMFRTSDGGESWMLLPNGTSADIQSLRFISP